MGKESLGIGFGWNAASTILTQVYSRFYRKNPQDLQREIGELFDQIREYANYRSLTVTGDDVEGAVKNYIYSDLSENDEKGKFFPDLNTIVSELNFVLNRKRSNHHKEIEDTRLSFEDKPHKEVSIKGSPVAQFLPNIDKFFVYDTSDAKCLTCKDRGRIRFYFVPRKPDHVFLGDEWLKLFDKDQAKAEMFRCHDCYCDHCQLGRLMWSKYIDNGKFAPPKLKEIERLVEQRKLRKQQRDIERAIDDGGEQGDLLRHPGECAEAIDPETRMISEEQLGS